MGELQVLRKGGGIETIVDEFSAPKILVGLNREGSQLGKRERRAIAEAFIQGGEEVYLTPENWPQDRYTEHNGIVIPSADFNGMGNRGNYIIGNKYILVSTAIEAQIKAEEKENPHVGKFFDGKERIFCPPYSKKLTITSKQILPEGELKVEVFPYMNRCDHLDLTIGNVPFMNRIYIDEWHFREIEGIIKGIEQKYGVEVKVTSGSNGQPRPDYPNNFAAVCHDSRRYVVAERDAPITKEKDVRVISPQVDILKLPRHGGSILCVSNSAPTTKLWDTLGIKYERFRP